MVAINLSHDLLPNLLIAVLESSLASRSVEDVSQLLLADLAIAICVEHVECNAQVLFV